MDKKHKELYERIKGYEVYSLGVNFQCQLKGFKIGGKSFIAIGSNHDISRIGQEIIINVEEIEEKNFKRITLEQAVLKSPEESEKLLINIKKAISEFGCTI